MSRRADEARRDVGTLATCLIALRDGDDGMDRDIAMFLIAETMVMARKHMGGR